MATTSSTTKTKPDNLTRSKSLGRKPKPVSSEANADGSDRKTIEKPLPNYLKPTISSRPDPVKFLRKNNAVEDNQKILRRRSFDRPPSSLTSPSTSSSHKPLNTSSAHPHPHPRDRPAVPREKPVTGLRSTSFHGSSRGGLRGSNTVKSPPVASRGSHGVKKSGLSGSGSSKSKKEVSENIPRNPSSKETTPETSPLAPAHEDEEEIVKVETNVDISDHREETKEEEKDQSGESSEEKETKPVAASTEEEKGELINEDKPEEQIEELKEPESTQEEDEDEMKKKVDDKENIETVATTDVKEAVNMEESKEVELEEAEESESSKTKEETTETKAQVEDLPEEGTKKEVVQGKKESPTAYNDVIASKMQENSKKNKVLALAGAFQTVIDYETAASK
ncbi:hypothetical protein CARUB_v10003514mg [Capsella rubella]|uniref:Calmodulin-binding domain-containing protein n=1 Tax=Capsella rubella TaxID=81985 RepID=R0FLD5_9BRAS|nr:microtubule-associated protein futsch [Capsella rubella]EOA22796.1 hypothetical protein CARUB_v10003514mg [Capsella rubella]